MFSPSMLLQIDDELVSIAFLNLCITNYLNQEADPEVDCLISPLTIPSILLEKYPPVRFHIAGIDPF